MSWYEKIYNEKDRNALASYTFRKSLWLMIHVPKHHFININTASEAYGSETSIISTLKHGVTADLKEANAFTLLLLKAKKTTFCKNHIKVTDQVPSVTFLASVKYDWQGFQNPKYKTV